MSGSDYDRHSTTRWDPAVLKPPIRGEALTTEEAVQFLADHGIKRGETTLRNWAKDRHVGRKIAGAYAHSKVALLMVLNGDDEALALYLDGDRSSPCVIRYYAELGISMLRHAPEHI